jgi:hypothetical protein
MRSMTFVLITTLCSASPVFGEATGNTKLTLTWTDSFDRTEPLPMKNILLQRQMTVTLNGGGNVTQRSRSTWGKENWDASFGAPLGKDWRVAGPNVLVRTNVFPNSVRVMRVTVTGSSCTLAITDTLKSGAADYILPMTSQEGKAGHYSRLSTSNPNCRID